MRNKIANHLFFFFLLVSGFFSFMSQPAHSSSQKIKTENGIPVVYNPMQPVAQKGLPSQVVPREDLVIGVASGDETYMFSALRSVQVDNDGNIYVLDWKEDKVKVFNKDGKHLRTFGKKGQGPGELQLPSRMSLTPGGKLAILDVGNKRLAYYSLTGECLKEIPSAKWNLIRTRVDSRSSVYGDNFVFGEKSLSERLLKFDPELNLISTISDVAIEQKIPKVNPIPDRFVYDIMKDDNFIWAFTTKYEFQIMNPEGKLVRKIIKDYDPVKITEKDKEKEIRDLYGDKGAPPGIVLEFPAYYSPIYSMLVDDQDRVFIRTNAKDAKGNYYFDVFSPDGMCYLNFTLAAEEIPMAVKKDRIYCLIPENQEGIPQVKRYSLEWK